MKNPDVSGAPNQAVALLSQLQGYDVSKFTPQHYKVHCDILVIAANATQLLNKIAESAVLLTHPSVQQAKEYHGQIKQLTDVIVRDSKVYKEELLKMHHDYHVNNMERVGKMSEIDILSYGIQVHQGYEVWINGFQNVVLIPFAALSNILEEIGNKYPGVA